MTRLFVIGEGIAAKALFYALAQRQKIDKFSEIHVAFSDSYAPATSLRSTAIAALRGTQKGFSPLGNELVEAWDFAHEIYSRENFSGAEKVHHETWIYEEKNLKRFAHLPSLAIPVEVKTPPKRITSEEAWMIEPEKFLSSIINFTIHSNINTHPNAVVKIEKVKNEFVVSFLGGNQISVDRLVLASGFWMSWMKEWIVASPLSGMYPVQGSYFQWEKIDWGSESRSISFDGANLIYQAKAQRLIIGATTVKKNESFIPAMSELKGIYLKIQSYWPISLPAMEAAEIITGIRSQTMSRRPWSGEVSPGVFAIGGMYKNGWVSAWKLADELAKRL
jgi:glycine/D-amino acid oxidase-like deaminating enzyme